MLRVLCHSEATGWTPVTDVSTVSDLRADRRAGLVWGEIDIDELGRRDIETIAEEFSLDRLALDDAIRPRQRPKLESYEHHHFAVLHELYELQDHLEKRQVSCFVGDDYMLILHEGADRVIDEARDRLTRSNHEPATPLYLLYTLLDTIVDGYQEHADRLEDKVESIEDTVARDAPAAVRGDMPSSARRHRVERVQLEVYSIKQHVARLRRYAVPLERVLHSLITTERERLAMSKDARRHFRDVHDHTLRIADQVHQVDVLAQAVLDVIRSEQAENLNEIQKRLTGWAAIFAVPTVIAGIYGMNYRLFPPAEARGSGFWFALGLMAASATTLYLYFKRKEWL